jgi:hypothetical protein
MQSATAVAVSLRDTRRRPSPPLSPITIMPPSCCPWRCCRCRPLQLRCYRATLHHLLTHCPPSTCRLVVTSGWLSLRHLSSCHHLSRHRLVVHVTSQCTTFLFAPAGCCVTLPPPPPLNVPACCHLASHHATLLFDPPGCPVTPRRATTSQQELSTSDVGDPSSSLSSLSSPFVVAHHAGHKPPSAFDAPVDGWLLCPLSPHLLPVNFDATPFPPSQLVGMIFHAKNCLQGWIFCERTQFNTSFCNVVARAVNANVPLHCQSWECMMKSLHNTDPHIDFRLML